MSSPGNFLVRGALATGAMQILGVGLTVTTAIVLARVLGEAGFGAYSYALTWGLVLLGPATLGLGPIVTRETAAGIETARWGRIRALRRFVLRTTTLGSLVVVVGGMATVWALRNTIDPIVFRPLMVGMVVTGLSAGVLVTRHALLGLRRVVSAQFGESVLRPALLLLAIWWASSAGRPLNAASSVGLYGVATWVVLVFLAWRVAGGTPSEVASAEPDPDRTWLRAALPLLLTGVARDLNAEAGILVMGSTLSPEDVGLFRAATRLAALPTFVLTAVNLSFQPVAASLFAKGDVRTIEILAVRASRVAVAVSLPVVIGFFVAGKPLLALFGPGFVAAEPALWILALGHLFNVSCGSVGVILVACKREDDAARGLILSCAVTLVANVVLIWLFGLIGAAIATALGLVVWNVALSWYTWERLGILPTAFSTRWRQW